MWAKDRISGFVLVVFEAAERYIGERDGGQAAPYSPLGHRAWAGADVRWLA